MKKKTSYKSRNSNVQRKSDNKKDYIIERNLKIILENKKYKINLKKKMAKYRKIIEQYIWKEKSMFLITRKQKIMIQQM